MSEIAIRIRDRGLRIPNTRAWGLGLAFLTACISGVAVYVNTYLVVQSDDATVYTTAKNVVAAALLVLALLAAAGTRRSSGPRKLTRAQWASLILLGLVGGSIPFVLFFEGLARAGSPTSAGFIHKTLVVWVAALAVLLLRERVTVLHLGAILFLVVGQAAIVDLSGLSFGTGELMILAATLLWAIELVIAKNLLATVPPSVAGSARLGIGIIFLMAFVLATGRASNLASLTIEQWGWAAVTGAILAAFVVTWFAALARAQAVDVTAVLVFGQVVTSVLEAEMQGAPISSDVAGLVLIMIGVAAAIIGNFLPRRETATA